MAGREQPYDPYIPAGHAGQAGSGSAQYEGGNTRTAAIQSVSQTFDGGSADSCGAAIEGIQSVVGVPFPFDFACSEGRNRTYGRCKSTPNPSMRFKPPTDGSYEEDRWCRCRLPAAIIPPITAYIKGQACGPRKRPLRLSTSPSS